MNTKKSGIDILIEKRVVEIEKRFEGDEEGLREFLKPKCPHCGSTNIVSVEGYIQCDTCNREITGKDILEMSE